MVYYSELFPISLMVGETVHLGSNGPDRMPWRERRSIVETKLQSQGKAISAECVGMLSEAQFDALETVFNSRGGVGAIVDVLLSDAEFSALLIKLGRKEDDSLLEYATGAFKERVLGQLPVE